MSLAQRRRGRPRFLTNLTLPTTGLFARFIAGVGETVSGGLVTNWADQSGNGWDATPSGANGPYSTTDFRGRRIVRLDSLAATGLNFAAAHSFSARNTSVFVVGRHYPPSGPSAHNIVGLLNYAGGSAHIRWVGSPSTFFGVGQFPSIKNHMNPAMLGLVTSGTATTGYTQYQNFAGAGPVTNDTDCAGASIGYFTGSGVTYADLYEIVVYEGTPSGADVAAITAYFTNVYRLRSTDYTKSLVFEGDSITAGAAVVQFQGYPFQSLRRGAEDWRMSDTAVSGSQIADLVTRAAVIDSVFESSYTRNVLAVMIGRNDLGALTAQQMYDALVPYVQARVAAGWEVWVGTIIATNSVPLQAIADSYNAKLRGTDGPGIIAAAGATRIVDYGALPEFATVAAASSLVYYQDGTHPTAAGATLLADLVAPMVGAY